MLNLLQYRAWALAEAYFNRTYVMIEDRFRLGHTLEGIIKKQSIEESLPMLEALMNSEEGHPAVHADVDFKFSTDPDSRLPIARVNNKNIALIPIIGPLTKRGDLCSLGMQHYQGMINKANAAPGVDGIVLLMDTPGGTVDGTPEFGLAIKNSMKPVGVFGDSMVASAGIWLSSQASVIVGNRNNPTSFGSIGVLMGLPNYQNVMDAGNFPRYEIFRADQSIEKALVNSIEPISEEGRKALNAELTAICAQFISTVKAGRGDKLDLKAEGLFNGRMFDVYKAKQIGLIDTVGTLQTAVTKVADLAREKQKQSSNQSTGTNQNANMDFPKLKALLGAAAALITGTGSDAKDSLTPEQTQASLEASEKKLTDAESEIARLVAENVAKDASISSLTATVDEHKAQITTLQGEKTTLIETVATQKAQLEKTPTGTSTTVIPGAGEAGQAADQGATTQKKSKFRSQADDESDAYVAAAGYSIK